MYNQGNFSSSSQFRPNNPQQSSMQPPSHQGGGVGAPPPPPLQPPQFPSAPAPLAVQHGGPVYYHGPPPPTGPPFPPRLAPIPSSHGQMLYSTATQFHPPPPPQHGQFLPPPPPSLPYSGFVPVTSSYVHSSYENPFETVSLPPSSLPPPQPPLPHDSTSKFSASSDGRNAEDGNRCVKGDTGEDSEVEGILPPPPRKPAEQEIVKNIEVLCNHIAKSENGPALEVRVKESGNPKFAFLFGGEPGSEAAIAHEYFLWMKSKCCMNLPLDKQPENTISLPAAAPLEIEDASHSAQDSDMEMEDGMNQSDIDQGVSDSVEGLKEHVFKRNEVSFVKEQSPGHPHLIFSPSVNITPGLLPGSKASVVAADGKEQQKCVLEGPSTEDDSSASGGLRYTYQKRKQVVPPTRDVILDSVPHADACVSGEEASGALIKSQSPLFRRLQEYASDDSAEDNDSMPCEDVSPVMVSPSITASKTSSHEDEMTILYADVGCENISAKEEVIMPSAESGSIQPIDPLSRKPNISQDSLEVIEASDMANDSLETTVKLQDNYSGDQTSHSLTFKDDIQGDAGIGSHSDRLRIQSTEKLLTSKKVDQFGRLVREDASESDSDGARYTRRRARRASRIRSRNRSRSKSRSRSRSRSRSPHGRRRRKSRSPRRRKDRRNRSRSWTPKRQRSRSRSPNFRHKGENVLDKKQDNRCQIPYCMDFFRGRCFRGLSCKYRHHTSTSGDPVKDNKSRNQEYLELPENPKNSDVNGVPQIVMNTNVGNTNPLSQVSVEHGTSLKEEFKNQEMLPYSSVEMRTDCRLSVNKNSGSVMDDRRRVTLSGSIRSAAGVNLSDSEAAITGVIVQQAPQEELGVQLKENEIYRQPLEILPSEVLSVQLKVVSEAQHLTGVVSQNEPCSLPNNVQPPQTNIPSSQHISQPFCGHPSNPYPIPTSMSQTQVHHVTASSSFPLQNIAPQPTDSKEFQQPNFPPSGFHSYASPLPRPPAFPQDVNAAYMSMPPTANIHGQLAPMERLPLYQAPFQDQHSQFPVPRQTWAPLPPASNSAFQNPAFHLQFLQQPMQPGNEFFRPVMRPYSHEVPYNNMSQLSVAGASKLHHNPYASTFEQTPGDSRFSSVLRQDMEPNYRSNNDSLGSNASISGQGIGAFDSKLTDLPLDSSRSGGQVLGNENLPLFESVESSSTTLGKLGNTGRQAVEGASAANMSPGDDELGDTAIDAEVGAVENGSPHIAEEGNWSPDNPADAGNTASGDDEVGQVETSGKSKKSKDSRSMKHFRAALADFVKDVLKPSWRQGNMSKEAFKTIVKKTVDKVSGAMKKHQIPKSQAKINQYVESSQRKLTKLVMGYVDKYVKV
ncbi:zinc finger CCCH domain-containing protein 55-like [Papaver somniferum]|uniref:zinc finger CCCH domain-containing protein 55-like n=1 Tax=Papaver somniferum TaxID=3469 RepID=UPI000E6F4CF8|nr:zinc finger CCCH domain-containing protein 55-like [Papaver somniferum]XP_026443400.1 zinc finger CCCH domain-containing protein 55-like [Papaver somniferum]